MNYGWARDYTLELINQYSIAGQKIAPDYNNQADYLARIPKLLNDAQVYAATTTGKIRTIAALKSQPRRELGAWWLYQLPKDCWQVCSGGLVRYDGPVLQRYHRYRLVGDNGIAIPKDLDGELVLEYYRYPLLLDSTPPDTAELDNTVEVQMALPYYAAAHLVMQDDAFSYSTLRNEFEGRMARLTEVPQTELTVVEDAYSASEIEYNQ